MKSLVNLFWLVLSKIQKVRIIQENNLYYIVRNKGPIYLNIVNGKWEYKKYLYEEEIVQNAFDYYILKLKR